MRLLLKSATPPGLRAVLKHHELVVLLQRAAEVVGRTFVLADLSAEHVLSYSCSRDYPKGLQL